MHHLLLCFLLLVSTSIALTNARPLATNGTQLRRIGDMLLKDAVDDYELGGQIPVPQLWPGGQVYYDIDWELSYLGKEYLITEAMALITSQVHGCVQFHRRSNQAHQVENYISFEKGDGCSSAVGMVGGAQKITLDYGCFDKGNILHELMHSLGFYHTHSRPDRDQYLNIFLENVEPKKQKNFIKFRPSQYPYDVTALEFDYESIMIYGEYAFTRNGFPTMEPKSWLYKPRLTNPNEKSRLSDLDVTALLVTYQSENWS